MPPTATVTVDPTNLFTSGGNLTERVEWRFAFDHAIEGFSDSQFQLSPPTTVTSLSHSREGNTNNYIIRATFPALQSLRTRTKLVYTGNQIRREDGNEVPYIRDIADPSATTPEDITTTPINVLVINGEPRLTGITGFTQYHGF